MDRVKTLLEVFLAPSDGLFFSHLFQRVIDANKILVGIRQHFAKQSLFVFRKTGHRQRRILHPLFRSGLPGKILALSLIQGDLSDLVAPNVQTSGAHVVVEGTEKLPRTIHAGLKVGKAPTHAFVNFTRCGCPTVKIGSVGIFVSGRREHDVTHLNGRHLVIARHQYAHCAADVRCSHGRTTPGCIIGRTELDALGHGIAAIVFTGNQIGTIHNSRGINGITRSNDRPPLGITGLVEVFDKVVLGRFTFAGELLEAGDGNPVLFCFRVEIGIERTIVRILHVAVARRHDLDDVRTLDSIVSRINKRGIFAVNLLEQEVFVFCLPRRVDFHHGADVKAVRSLLGRTSSVYTGIGTETIVDDAAALFTILSNDVLSQLSPTVQEELVIQERTIVRIVRAAGIADMNIGTPGNAMEFGTIAICTDGTGHVRAVRIVHIQNPVTRDVITLTGFVLAVKLATGTLRITIARGAVLTLVVRRMETIPGKFRMLLKKRTGVHHADGNTLTVVAKRISRGGIHGR